MSGCTEADDNNKVLLLIQNNGHFLTQGMQHCHAILCGIYAFLIGMLSQIRHNMTKVLCHQTQ